MHIDDKAGEKLFVDYAGDKLAIFDPDSGKEQAVETYVAILAASELTCLAASATQQATTGPSIERALCYFGRSTQVIVPDNLPSAVSRSDPYGPGISATLDAVTHCSITTSFRYSRLGSASFRHRKQPYGSEPRSNPSHRSRVPATTASMSKR